ncbi:mannose-6-phosphate isomerase, class I, partial [Mesorhizobium sp. M00.F.Ca.ET.217.01.1.1]
VQVHPDNAYAQKYEGEYGKTECWYILDAQEDAEIIYGVNAKNQTELNDMIDQQQFDELFHKVKVKAGDFFYVPAGTVHAIGEGILILETQQSSDTTYRIYDYERTDTNG